jgi:hypothetical protein
MTISRTLRHHTLTFAALLVSGPACRDDSAGMGGSATEPTTSGSPTSFTPTDPGDDPTTGDVTTTVDATTTDATTGSSLETTSEAICGNGLVEPGEGCDDGSANDVYSACTDECQPNVCGDGKVHVGVEQCDEAAANVNTGYCLSDCQLNVCGDGYLLAGLEECDSGMNGPIYGGCDESCTINRCGDGELDVGHEQCDAGSLINGSGESGEDGMAGCGHDCGFAGLRIFLSSQLFTGDMGSRVGADLACQTMALNAKFSHPERFVAVLADSQSSPNTLLAGDASGLPYISPSGLILAASYPALIALGPGSGITTTEIGEMLMGERIWTNVNGLGSAYLLEPEFTCADWTSADATMMARIGVNAVEPDELIQWQEARQWVSYAMKSCKEEYRIYCVETPA